MKKIKTFVSLALVIAMLCACTVHAFAVESNSVSPDEKISEELKQKMDDSSDEELIPVWIWYKDIDQTSVDIETEKEIGFTKEDCDLITKVTPDITQKGINRYSNGDIAERINKYLDSTSKERETEEFRSQTYIDTRRAFSSEKYKEKSDSLLKETGLNDKSILFRSEFAPMFIANLSPEEIVSVSKNNSIESLSMFSFDEEYFREENLSLEQNSRTMSSSDYNEMIKSMGLEEVYDRLNLTGNGIKIGLIEDRVPGIGSDDESMLANLGFNSQNILNIGYDPNQFDNLQNIVANAINNFENPNLLKVVVLVDNDHISYTYPDYSLIDNIHSHPNNSVRVMISENEGIAQDAQIYASFVNLHEFQSFFMNLEALIKCGVNVIVQNNGFIYHSQYITFLNNITKYIDHIVKNHNLLVVCSSGNGIQNFINGDWIYPYALSYNCIGVGGYDFSVDGDDITFKRMNYRWINKNGTDTFCEKPDVLFYAKNGGGTCVAADTLTAVISLMYELKPSLKTSPLATKAIVLASCHRKAEPCTAANDPPEYMYDGITERQGAGIPDAWVMAQIILQGTYANGTISAGGTINYNVNITPYSNYDFNMSLTWFRNTSALNSHFEYSNITASAISDINLYLNNDSSIKSELLNSSTEMCYFNTNGINSPFSFRIENNDSSAGQIIACAWSTSDREKELHHIEMSGKPAVGKTLSVKGYCNDGTQAPANSLNYQWMRSSDGTTWSNISGATLSSYTLTSSDILSYIKCTATPNNTSIVTSTSKSDSTDLKIIRFGDVNFDGLVTNTDATLVQQHISHMITLNNDALRAADVDANNLVNVGDAMMIQMYVDGMITQFPAEA